MKTPLHRIVLCLTVALITGCGDDVVDAPNRQPVEANQSIVGPVIPLPDPVPPLPALMPAEIDQVQESEDEGTVTSFGVDAKGWQSYTAGKKGCLTYFTLYGSAHNKNARHKSRFMYGDTIWGEIQLAQTKEKLGTWKLTRAEVVAQLASQGLKPSQFGWISVKISDDQRIPQVPGETYVIQSTKIAGGSPWFGSFRVRGGNNYPDGEWWHTRPGSPRLSDLVFRTYVAKTVVQDTKERAIRLEQVERQLREEKNITKEIAPPPTPSPQPPVTDPLPPAPRTPPPEFVPIAPPDPPLPRPSVEENASEGSGKKPSLPGSLLKRPR